MVNPFQIFQAMKNPVQAIISQQAARMRQANPELYSRTMNLIQGKSEAQLKEMAENMAKDRGINLADLAKQFGINL